MSSLFQNSNYIGNNLTAILYGVELVVYGTTVHALWTKPKRGRADTFFILFSTTLLILMTILYSTNAAFGEEMWIVHAKYPGGMDAYLAAYVNVWYQTLSSTSPTAANLLGDALMIYRCYVLYNSIYIILFPSLLWLGSFASGVLFLYASGNPHGDFFEGFAQNCGLGYYTTTIFLNFLTTTMIIGRLLWVARYMRKNLGRATSETYVNVIAIIVESALPYTLIGIANLITYGVRSDTNVLFAAMYGMMTGLAPQLIIMRVIKGRAISRRDMTEVLTNSMTFAPGNNGIHEVAITLSIQLQTMSKPPSTIDLLSKV
ncbi:hypothetical protein EVJ58_g8145 [Rhodofomes roseus]|uniref:G protein-coupled receptor n=1 Tax=Rhodofomes roseus TaxID=34475 RepID=A0A4Y9Y4A1_9APHY|nr:hypothetical protein EVJ58_g8145 [Rhodofomes roseus]